MPTGCRRVEDDAIRYAVAKQESVGLQSATDGEFRRESWHMDFIYQLDGITKESGHIAVKFFNEDGEIEFTPAALHIGGKLGISHTIFGDAFSFLGHGHEQRPEADDSVAEHGATTAAARPRSTSPSIRSWTPSGPT